MEYSTDLKKITLVNNEVNMYHLNNAQGTILNEKR